LYSDDNGRTWQTQKIPRTYSMRYSTFGDGMFSAVNYGQSWEGNLMVGEAVSRDGLTWNSINDGEMLFGLTEMTWLGIAYGNGRFVAVGGYHSNDGQPSWISGREPMVMTLDWK
jgi:hypothetical protein